MQFLRNNWSNECRKKIVSNIFKMIPGVGTIAGGAISAATAATLTTALGETYIVILGQIAKGKD